MKHRAYDFIPLPNQAYLASEFYKKRGPGPIHVFPCKRTGHSVDFRKYLARYISDSKQYDREHNEELCAELGFPFVEVDPNDYK